MSSRHRISYQALPPWQAGSDLREPIDLFGTEEHRAGPATDTGTTSLPWLLLAAAVAALFGSTVLFGSTPAGGDDPTAGPAPGSRPHTDRSADRVGPRDELVIRGEAVLAFPFDGSINRYRASTTDRTVDRAHVIALRPSDRSGHGPTALLVVDATRRADVAGASGTRSPNGLAVRVLESVRGGPTVYEWDADGRGASLTVHGLDRAGALRLVDAVRMPTGEPRSPRSPVIDRDVLDEVGLAPGARRALPVSLVGGPLVGQAGLDAIEAFVHRVDGQPPAGLLLTGSIGAAVRAADVASVPGTTAVVDPPWAARGSAVALELVTTAPVGFRITGTSRLIFDHPDGVTFWLSSDELMLPGLVAAARAIDFDLIAARLRGS